MLPSRVVQPSHGKGRRSVKEPHIDASDRRPTRSQLLMLTALVIRLLIPTELRKILEKNYFFHQEYFTGSSPMLLFLDESIKPLLTNYIY